MRSLYAPTTNVHVLNKIWKETYINDRVYVLEYKDKVAFKSYQL